MIFFPSGSQRLLKLECRFGVSAERLYIFNDRVDSDTLDFCYRSRSWLVVTTWGTWTWMRLTTSCPSWWRGRKMQRWRRWSATAPRTSCGSNTATFTVSKETSPLSDAHTHNAWYSPFKALLQCNPGQCTGQLLKTSSSVWSQVEMCCPHPYSPHTHIIIPTSHSRRH